MLRYSPAKRLNLRFIFILTVVLELSVPGSGRATATGTPGRKVDSIAVAVGLPLGTSVTVEGVVTVPSGAFKSSRFDEGFVIQDKSGGIYVSLSANLNLKLREQVRVTGKLARTKARQLILESSADSILPRGGRAPAVRAQQAASSQVNEQNVGRLLKLTGTISKQIVADPPYGFYFYVEDGHGAVKVFVSASTGITSRGLRQGRRISVTGVGGNYEDHFEIEPRLQTDIQLQAETVRKS